MCSQSLCFECSLDRVFHESVRKNTTIILILEEGRVRNPKPYSWIRHCNVMYRNNFDPWSDGFIYGRERREGSELPKPYSWVRHCNALYLLYIA